MRIAILGFGREGQSVFRFIKRYGGAAIKNSEIWILDKNKNIEVPAGLKKQTGASYLKDLERFDVIYRSPGVPYNAPELKRARAQGAIFSSATKIFFNRCPGKIIGITGTKGKGTTATLLYKVLKAARKPVFLAGNIGRSPLELLPKLNKKSLVILELSSFQLQDLEKSPPVAVILDIFPDHQDAHLSLKEYYVAKTSVARHQKVGDKIFYFSAKGGSAVRLSPSVLSSGSKDSPSKSSGGKNSRLSRWAAAKGRGRKFPVDEREFGLFKPGELKIKGWHNFKNAVMAATVAKNLGIPTNTIYKVATSFRGNEHRLELVRCIRDPNPQIHPNAANEKLKIRGIRVNSDFSGRSICFYNDSASTNPQTTAAAIRSFPNTPKILIAGGYDKGLDYKPLAAALKNSNTKLAVLFGENKNKIAKAIKKQETRDKRQECAVVFTKNLGAAVKKAYEYALYLAACRLSLVTVIFSPGAASFDMFKNYADRGRQFKKIVKKLKPPHQMAS